MTADLEKLVKPFEWTKHPTVDGWRCDTLVGTYKVFGLGLTPSWDFDGSNGEARSRVSKTIEAAKAAAQADYARRIVAALDPDAVARMVQEAVQAEREACAKRKYRRPSIRNTGHVTADELAWDMQDYWRTASEWLEWIKRKDGGPQYWNGRKWHYPIRPEVSAHCLPTSTSKSRVLP